MTHITEIVPDLDKMPDWAREAFEDGQFFGAAFLRVERLEGGIVALQRYVVHGEVCTKGRRVWNGGSYETKPCDCGLDEVRAALKTGIPLSTEQHFDVVRRALDNAQEEALRKNDSGFTDHVENIRNEVQLLKAALEKTTKAD